MPLKIKSSGSYYATIDDSALTTDRIYSLPNIAGTLLTSTITQNVTVSGSNLTVSGSILMSGSLNTPVLIDYEERYSSPTISAGGLTLNLANGNVFDVALNAAITTLTISSPPAANNAGSFTLIFTADGTARAVSWPTSVTWSAATPPTLTSTNGKKDVFGFISLNGGTNWYGFVGGQNF